jgi:hypothetical protein
MANPRRFGRRPYSLWPKDVGALVNMAFGQNKNGLACVPGALPALPQATVKMAFGQRSQYHCNWAARD